MAQIKIARILKPFMDIELLSRKFYDYSLYMRGYTKNTIRGYRGAIRYYAKFAHLRYIEEVTEQNVHAFFVYGRVERKWSARTFIDCYHNLIVFFRWCVSNGYLANNPITNLELPKVEKRLPQKLTKQDAMKILEIAYNYPYDYKFLRYRNHAIFSMFIFAGLRKSELLNLAFTDVDIANLTIFVRQGKGSKDRIIPMSYTLAQSLTSYVAERKRLGKTCNQFFASLNRNLGFTDIGLKRLVIKIRQASSIRFTAHKLRHTFATLMLEGGCDIYSLSRMMGHSDIKTTTIYLSASAEHLRSQVGKHPLNDLVRFG
jgi:site-specific recombinase XerD